MHRSLLWISIGAVLCMVIALFPRGRASARNESLPAASNGYDLVVAVNALRASNGLAPYSINSILMKIAQDQADYLASTGAAYGHVGAGGTLPYQRALNSGYSVENALSNPPGLFSENWDASSSIQAAINAWEGDSAHRIALYSTNLFDIGGGVASANGLNYYVIDTGASGNSGLAANPTNGSANGTQVPQSQLISAAIVSTPDQAGNVYHVVQPGQSLWQIAIAYKVRINDIKQLNSSVGADNMIQAGQKLLIMRVNTATPMSPTPTPVVDLSAMTPLPTLQVATEIPAATSTLNPAVSVERQGGMVLVGGIIIVALIAAGFLAWAGRHRPI